MRSSLEWRDGGLAKTSELLHNLNLVEEVRLPSPNRVRNGPNVSLKKPHHGLELFSILLPGRSRIEIIHKGDVKILQLRLEFRRGNWGEPHIEIVKVGGVECCSEKKST